MNQKVKLKKINLLLNHKKNCQILYKLKLSYYIYIIISILLEKEEALITRRNELVNRY